MNTANQPAHTAPYAADEADIRGMLSMYIWYSIAEHERIT